MDLCNFWRKQEVFLHHLWFLLTFASNAHLWVCTFMCSFDIVTPNPSVPAYLLHQSMALQYCPGTYPSASHGRKGTEILWKKPLAQIYRGSRQAQEQQKMNAGWVLRKRADLPALQGHRRWASGYLDVCQQHCWASGNPGHMQGDTVLCAAGQMH